MAAIELTGTVYWQPYGAEGYDGPVDVDVPVDAKLAVLHLDLWSEAGASFTSATLGGSPLTNGALSTPTPFTNFGGVAYIALPPTGIQSLVITASIGTPGFILYFLKGDVDTDNPVIDSLADGQLSGNDSFNINTEPDCWVGVVAAGWDPDIGLPSITYAGTTNVHLEDEPNPAPAIAPEHVDFYDLVPAGSPLSFDSVFQALSAISVRFFVPPPPPPPEPPAPGRDIVYTMTPPYTFPSGNPAYPTIPAVEDAPNIDPDLPVTPPYDFPSGNPAYPTIPPVQRRS